jgi:hypothetical protein
MSDVTHNKKKLTPELKQAFRLFFEIHHPEWVSRNLRRMLLSCLENELKIGVPLYFDEWLWQINDLFELLDTVTKETESWHHKDS